MYTIDCFDKDNKLLESCSFTTKEEAKSKFKFLIESYNGSFHFVELLDEDTDEIIDNWNSDCLIESKSDEIASFIEDLYDLRKGSIEAEGEYGIGNLIFKEFRNRGYLDNLKNMRKQELSKELSLEQLDESQNSKLNYADKYKARYRRYSGLEEGIEITEDNLNTWALNRISAEDNFDINDLKELLLSK